MSETRTDLQDLLIEVEIEFVADMLDQGYNEDVVEGAYAVMVLQGSTYEIVGIGWDGNDGILADGLTEGVQDPMLDLLTEADSRLTAIVTAQGYSDEDVDWTSAVLTFDSDGAFEAIGTAPNAEIELFSGTTNQPLADTISASEMRSVHLPSGQEEHVWQALRNGKPTDLTIHHINRTWLLIHRVDTYAETPRCVWQAIHEDDSTELGVALVKAGKELNA